VNDSNKKWTTAQIVAESLRRWDGKPTMPDEDFEEAVNAWVSSLPPRTEPYTLKDLREAATKLRSGIFGIEPYLNKPFPDDPRWTPYTRFVEPYLTNLTYIIDELIIQEAKGQKETHIHGKV
jgi:hypothetical protein